MNRRYHWILVDPLMVTFVEGAGGQRLAKVEVEDFALHHEFRALTFSCGFDGWTAQAGMLGPLGKMANRIHRLGPGHPEY